MYKEYTALLKAPDGSVDTYRVSAKNKTDARKKIADIYRTDTPSWRNGFYSFAKQKLTWIDSDK